MNTVKGDGDYCDAKLSEVAGPRTQPNQLSFTRARTTATAVRALDVVPYNNISKMRRRWILNGEEEEETRKITFCDLMEKNGGPEHVESKLIEPTTTTTSIVSCTLSLD